MVMRQHLLVAAPKADCFHKVPMPKVAHAKVVRGRDEVVAAGHAATYRGTEQKRNIDTLDSTSSGRSYTGTLHSEAWTLRPIASAIFASATILAPPPNSRAAWEYQR